MAETAVSLAGKHALPKILEAIKMVRDLPKEVRDITDELESFQDFINDADKVAEAEQDDGRRHRIKERVMRLREAAFHMEDVIDEYNISCEDKQPGDPRCAALLCEAVDFIKTQILRLQSAYKIQDVKSLVRAERDGFQTHFPLEPRLTSSRGNQDVTWQKLRMDPLFIEENDVVGLDGPRDTLKNWLTKGREKRTVISVVGIPGVGKTTLAKQVYDQVRNNFDYYALITVSQSYSAEGLLRRLLDELCKVKKEDPPKGVSNMESLTEEVRNRCATRGETLHFQCGGFQKLKQLSLISLDQLKCILIDRGALCSVEEISLVGLSQLKTVPSGIQHLEKLKDLIIDDMPTEFEQRIAPDGGEDHWIIQDVPHVRIWSEDAKEPSHIFGRSHH